MTTTNLPVNTTGVNAAELAAYELQESLVDIITGTDNFENRYFGGGILARFPNIFGVEVDRKILPLTTSTLSFDFGQANGGLSGIYPVVEYRDTKVELRVNQEGIPLFLVKII